MKIKSMRACSALVAASGLILMAGCVIEPPRVAVRGPVVVAPVPPPPPPLVVVAPAPPPPGPVVYVPDSYFWDGYEYVGLVGDDYCYLGPGNVWVVCEPWRLNRVHVWIHGHPDWHAHLVVNERFRTDRYGHVAPHRGEEMREHREDRRDDRH